MRAQQRAELPLEPRRGPWHCTSAAAAAAAAATCLPAASRRCAVLCRLTSAACFHCRLQQQGQEWI